MLLSVAEEYLAASNPVISASQAMLFVILNIAPPSHPLPPVVCPSSEFSSPDDAFTSIIAEVAFSQKKYELCSTIGSFGITLFTVTSTLSGRDQHAVCVSYAFT